MSEDENVSMEEETNSYEDVYDDDGIEELEENDEISPEEQAFMRGYRINKEEDDK